jgi:hypothetical protein
VRKQARRADDQRSSAITKTNDTSEFTNFKRTTNGNHTRISISASSGMRRTTKGAGT